MTFIFGRNAVTALLLVLSAAAATAQTSLTNDPLLNDPMATPRDRSIKLPATQAAPTDAAQPSLARDAIRVPAMGTGPEPQSALTLADKTAEKTAEKTSLKSWPRKRPRVIVRREFADLPPPHYAPMPYTRFGYGYGPGIRFYRY